MARLRGLKHDPTNKLVNEDFKEMEDSINEQHSAGQGTWLECITGQPSGIPRLVYRTVLGCALQFAQQWYETPMYELHVRHTLTSYTMI
jgi:SP family sugar:H+ symporter-like MFS transporter